MNLGFWKNLNKIVPVLISAAKRSGVRRGIRANFVVEESAPPTTSQFSRINPAASRQSFLRNYNKPIVAMAPMADVTDRAFRQIIAKYSKMKGASYVTWTEFVSGDGLMLGGYDKLIYDLKYTESERPIVAQVFSSKPEIMEKVAKLVVEIGFDGLDINMGCPDRGIEKQLSGAALIKNPELAVKLIRAAQKGVKDAGSEIPVSVKTRIGYNKIEIDTWLPTLLSAEPAVVTLHARTRKEMSKVPANWDIITRAVKIRDGLKSETLIFGNGDVESVADAKKKAEETGCDGVMIGRGMFGNPWIFANLTHTWCGCKIERPVQTPPLGKDTGIVTGINKNIENATQSRNSAERSEGVAPFRLCGVCAGYYIPVHQKLQVMVEHTKLFEELLGGIKSFAIMKKHYKAYSDGFEGAKDLRIKLMEAKDASEVEKIVNQFLRTT